MTAGYPDYAYTLDFLKRLNGVIYQNKPLRNSFFYDEYNLWHSYQQLLFEDIKRFSKTRSHVGSRLTPLGGVRYVASGVFMGVLSAMALLKLWIFRTPVLIYTIDRDTSPFHSDFRLNELYRFLHEKGIEYVECMHTVPGRTMYKHAVTRKRAALYLEFFDFLFWLLTLFRRGGSVSVFELDMSTFSEDEQHFARSLIESYIKRVELTHLKVRGLQAILARSHLKTVFAIDDARYYHELFLSAYLADIPTCALQHGHFTRYHVGWLWDPQFSGKAVVPDIFLVWNQYWKDELLRLGTHFSPESIVVGGTKDAAEKRGGAMPLHAPLGEEVTVLIPYETACPKSEVAEYVKNMLMCKHVRVVFKLRPDMPPEQQLEEYGLLNKGPRLSAVVHVKGVIEKVDVVVGVYSTYLYEMVAEGKPVGILETSSDYGAGMVDNGLANEIGKKNLCADLRELASMPTAERVNRRNKLVGYKRVLLRDTLADMAHEYGLDMITR